MSTEKLTERPGYYAVIPAVIRYDKDLSPMAKLLYGEITCLLHFNNKCFASNKYFSRLYSISEIQVSRLINQLVRANYITSQTEKTGSGTRRIITTPSNVFDVSVKIKKDKAALIKNDDIINNKSINKQSLSKDNDIEKKSEKKFSIPTLEAVKEYFVSLGFRGSEPESFHDFYTSKGWMVGKTKMKDWKAAVRNWIRGIKKEDTGDNKQIVL